MHPSRTALATSVVVAVFALSASGGCGADAGATDAGMLPELDAACAVGGGTPPWLVLGTGEASFVELAEGAELELVLGPQGGYHVLTTTLLGLAASPDGAVLHYEAKRLDGTSLGTADIALLERRLVRACGGWFRGGDRVILSIAGPADVAGTDLDLSVSVLQGTTELVRDSRRVHIVDLIP